MSYPLTVLKRPHIKGQTFASYCYTNRLYFVFQFWKSMQPHSQAEMMQLQGAYLMWRNDMENTCMNKPCAKCLDEKLERLKMYAKYHADIVNARKQRIRQKLTPRSLNLGDMPT